MSENIFKFGVTGYRRGFESLTAHTLDRCVPYKASIMRHVLKLIFALTLISCVHNSHDRFKVDYVRSLIKKVGFQNLPYSHDLIDDKIDSKYDINRNSLDTLYFNDLNSHIVGVLPDTTNFYCFLYFGVGDALYPCLTTIDKNGNKIDSKSICIGQCAGIMIQYDTCIDNVTIEKDMTINMYYRLHGFVNSKNDSNKIDTICNMMIWTGRIDKNGKIIVKESELQGCK
jgi:hypothetical protein